MANPRTATLANPTADSMDVPGTASGRLVAGVLWGCAVIVVVAALASIYAGVQWPILPGFNWAFASVYLLTGLITGVLLLQTTPETWSWPIALLASGYLYSAVMTVPFLLSFPGLFDAEPVPLLGGSQSSVWTFYLWNAGFLLFVLASTLAARDLRRRRATSRDAGRLGEAPHRALVILLAAVPSLAIAVVVLAAGAALPDLLGVGLTNQKTVAFHMLAWSVVALGLVTLGFVVAESRYRAHVRVWLVPVVLLTTFAAVSLPDSGRYSVGWYAPRMLGMVATTALLVALLVQVWRQAEALMVVRAASDRLAKIVEQSPSGFALIDVEGRFVEVNQAFCDLTGVQRDELIGASSELAFGPAESLTDIGSLMTGDTRSLTLRRSLTRRDGSSVWVNLTAHRMFDSDGLPVGLALSASDASGEMAADLDPHAPVGSAMVNADGVITRVTQAMCTLVGRDQAELIGLPFMELVADEDREAASRSVSSMGRGEAQVSGGELRLLRRDGEPFFAMVYGSALRDARGTLVGAALQVIDIDDRKRAEADALEAQMFLEYRSTYDELTGLLNRPTFVDRLQAALDAGSTMAVLTLDIDRFQRVSNSMTRRDGDQVLEEAVRRLLALVDQDDLVARIGGDEFAVAVRVPDGVAASTAVALADRLRDAVGDRPFTSTGHETYLTCCVGATIAGRGDVAVDRVQEADLALREAKGSGVGQCRFYDQRMREALLRRLDMVERIRAALLTEEFTAWYQPVVALDDGRLLGFEALSRWVRPDASVVPPDDYLPAAEDSGLVVPIGAFTVEAAVAHLSRLPAPLQIAVNASPTELLVGDFARRVEAVLGYRGVAPERLMVEITEQAMFDVGRAEDAGLTRLADLGVALYVDDFGTGYSSITHLRDFPIRGIKLDRSFTANLDGEGGRAAEIASTLAGLANRLELDSVAEGVETQEQADRLAAMGWRAGQGWLFGRAQPASSDSSQNFR